MVRFLKFWIPYFLLCAVISLGLCGCTSTSTLVHAQTNDSSEMSIDLSNESQQSSQNLDKLYYKYFKDVADAAITSQSWDDASQIRPEFLVGFFGERTELNRLSTDDKPVAVPEELVESFIQLYFDVDTAHMRQAISYNKETHAYDLSIPSSGAVSYKVIDAVKKDNILILSYEYYSPADDVTVIRQGKLKIAVTDYPYRYQYISCDTAALRKQIAY